MDFDALKDSFTKTTDKIMKVSGEVIDATKAGYAVSKTRNQMDEKYRSIGKLIYERYLEGEGSSDGDVRELCLQIDTLRDTLLAQEERLREAKRVRNCPSCGKEISKESQFCPFCGSKTQG